MQKIDAALLATELNRLADVFDRKPLSVKALEVWFDTLKEFPTERVAGMLIGWPKTHGKFPAPAELWKACNDSGTGEREAKAEAERKVVFEPKAEPEHVRKMLGAMRAVLRKPKRAPRDHWQHLLATKPHGSISYRFAQEALSSKAPTQRARIPGEDDEQLQATA